MFRFKQFDIEDEHCAMKVGTDAVLLGAWVEPLNSTLSTLHLKIGITGATSTPLWLMERVREKCLSANAVSGLSGEAGLSAKRSFSEAVK